MGILNRTSNISKSKSKIPDYAKDYKNEYLFIRGIDTCFKFFLDNLDKADEGVFQNHRVDIIKKYINKLEKAQRLGYLKHSTNIEIVEVDVIYSSLLLEVLADYKDNDEFDVEMFNSYVDLEFPGYKNLLKCIGEFHSKFKLVTFEYLINRPDSDDDGLDSDDIGGILGGCDDSDSDSDSDSDY